MNKKIKTIIIWGLYVLVWFGIGLCHAIQATSIYKPFIECLIAGLYMWGIPYVLLVTFYCIAIQTKQYLKIIWLILLDIGLVAFIITYCDYFNEYKYAFINGVIAFVIIILVKTAIMIKWKKKKALVEAVK